MSEITNHIGQRIRLYRKNKQLTLEQFAAQLHKSKSTVSKYECGEISIDIETLYEIADALQISIRQLLDRVEPHTGAPLMPRGFLPKVHGSMFTISTKTAAESWQVYWRLLRKQKTIIPVYSTLISKTMITCFNAAIFISEMFIIRTAL